MEPSREPQFFEVELPSQGLAELNLAAGQRVRLVSSQLRVFAQGGRSQQLRIIRETVKRNFNLTDVANVLYTSQSGVSKQIKDLEDELGVELFGAPGKAADRHDRARQGAGRHRRAHAARC